MVALNRLSPCCAHCGASLDNPLPNMVSVNVQTVVCVVCQTRNTARFFESQTKGR